MRVIVKDRGEGKTVDLIRRSALTGFYMVVRNHQAAHDAHLRSLDMGLLIPFPLTYDEFLEGRYNTRGIRGVLIDDADELLRSLARGGAAIDTITLSWEPEEIGTNHVAL